ncbi:hypothetical protein [Haloprofundus salilacus]|uniref:hypothetical protein n=1 Tax=Haloprofundus salilacus TaxID=2876190 RepID=UPI001CCB0264|nr:hypothetical protein [Haloprofundus salilacus]
MDPTSGVDGRRVGVERGVRHVDEERPPVGRLLGAEFDESVPVRHRSNRVL